MLYLTFGTCFAVALTNIQYSVAKRSLATVQKSNSTVRLEPGQENGACTCRPKLTPAPTLVSVLQAVLPAFTVVVLELHVAVVTGKRTCFVHTYTIFHFEIYIHK